VVFHLSQQKQWRHEEHVGREEANACQEVEREMASYKIHWDNQS